MVSTIYCIYSLEIYFVLANTADPGEMLHYVADICVFTVCKSNPFGVSGLQSVKRYRPLSSYIMEHTNMSQCMRFPTMWNFDMCRLGQASVASF